MIKIQYVNNKVRIGEFGLIDIENISFEQDGGNVRVKDSTLKFITRPFSDFIDETDTPYVDFNAIITEYNSKLALYLVSVQSNFEEVDNTKKTFIQNKIVTNGIEYKHLASTGLYSGGVITLTGGVGFSVSAGEGVSYNNGNPKKVTWGALSGSTPLPNNNYISIDEDGLLDFSVDYPDDNKIKIGFLYTDDTNTQILGFSSLAPDVKNLAQQVQNFYRRALGTLVTKGTQVSEQATPNELKLTINAGESFAQGSFNNFTQTSSFTKFFQSSDNGFVIDSITTANTINVNQYNNVNNPQSTALVNMTSGYWKKDLILRAPNGLVLYVYGDSEWATEEEAINAPFPDYPDSIKLGSVKLASIVVQQGTTSIASGIKDLRPILSRIFDTGVDTSLSTVVDHGALAGLGDDDHTQYYNQTRGDARYYRVTNPSGFETPSQLNSRDTANRDRNNHSGTQLASTISDLTDRIKTDETNTSLQQIGSILRYINEDNVNFDVNIPFGSEFQYFLDDTPFTTTNSVNYVAANTFNTNSLVGGNYRIGFQWNWTNNSTNSSSRFIVFVDGVPQSSLIEIERKDTTDDSTEYVFLYLPLTAGVHTIQLGVNCEGGISTTVSVIKCEFFRIN